MQETSQLLTGSLHIMNELNRVENLRKMRDKSAAIIIIIIIIIIITIIHEEQRHGREYGGE